MTISTYDLQFIKDRLEDYIWLHDLACYAEGSELVAIPASELARVEGLIRRLDMTILMSEHHYD